MPATPQATITSYGARWNDPPPHHDGPALLLNVSGTLWDPAADAITQNLVPLTGLDAAVRDRVLATPGAATLIEGAARDVLALHDRRADGAAVRLDVHCWYGRHRAPAVAEAIGTWLREHGAEVQVEHRHIGRPVVHRDPAIGQTCAFCRIAAGTEPADVVREWEDAVAIKSRADTGHTLVIPRRHVSSAITDPAVTARTMARAAELGADLGGDLDIITSVAAEATRTVRHLQMRLAPRGPDGSAVRPRPYQSA
ncbi:HIT family protein [Streptomyces aculeolatus]